MLKQRIAAVYPYIPLSGLLLLAAFLRFYHLDHASLWSDEGNTWALMERSFGQIAWAAAADIHPPGYYWLLKLWTTLFGATAWGMRSFSALTGVLLVYAIYQIACRLMALSSPLSIPRPRGISTALAGLPWLAAWLAALNPLQIYYSQEARMYMLLTLESAGLFWALLTLIAECRTSPNPEQSQFTLPWSKLAFCLCAIAGLWTHYSFPIVLAAADLAYLYAILQNPSSKIRHLKSFLLWHLLILLAFLPWLPTAIDRILHWPKGGVATPLNAALSLTLQTLSFGPLRELPQPVWPWLWGSALLPLVGLLTLRRNAGLLALTLWLLAPSLLLVGLGLFSPAFLKFLLAASPAWCIACAAAPALINLGYRQVNLLSLLVTLGGIALAWSVLPAYYTNSTVRDNYAGVARYIQVMGNAEQDLVLLDAPGQQEVWRYYDPGIPLLALPQQRPPDPEQTRAALATAVADHTHVYALFWATDEADPQGVVEHWLDQHAFKGVESWQGNLRFVTYSLANGLTCQDLPVPPAFGQQISLLAYCQPATQQQVAAGEVALVGLRWQATQSITQRYKVTVQLLDKRNQVLAQHDGEPAGGAQPTTDWAVGTPIIDNHGLMIPPGTPPGSYRLIVALYDSTTGQRLLTPSGEVAELGQIQVLRPARPLPLDIIPMQHRLNRQFSGLTLVGYAAYRQGYSHAPETPISVGEQVHFTFYWQAVIPLPPDLTFTLRLGDQQLTAPLAGGSYPTGQWQPGELVRGEFDLPFDGQNRTPEVTLDGQAIYLMKLPAE